MSRKLQAPRGTYDVFGDDAMVRVSVEKQAGQILGRAGYARIETPATGHSLRRAYSRIVNTVQ